jgi:hypothetical protein
MILVMLIRTCLNETCSKVHVGKVVGVVCFLLKVVYNKEMLYHHCFSVLL